MTAADLAGKTNTDERYVREWLSAQAARAGLSPTMPRRTPLSRCLNVSKRLALAVEDSPAYMPGAFHIASAR